MIRRSFLKDIFYSISLLFLQPLKVLKAQALSLTITKANKTLGLLPLVERKGLFYFSLESFAGVSGFASFTNTQKKKTLLTVGQTKIKFTADNPFVIINDQIVQIVHLPFWRDGSVWVPAPEFCRLISDFTSVKLEYQTAIPQIRILPKNVNITAINFEHKVNGILITLSAATAFNKKQLHTRVTNDWLYLEIIGGKGDVKSINRKVKDKIISEIRAIQFEQLLSIGFRLKKMPEDYEVIFNPDSQQILLTLRYKTIAREDDEKAPGTEETNESITSDLEDQKSNWLIDTIVIDPGHGGKDPGALGYYHLKEKDIVLSIALKLGKYLKKRLPGVKILYTRQSDVFIPLWQRTQFANKHNGKLFVSIHCNSNSRHSVNGFETYFLSAEKNAKARDAVLLENKSIEFETREDKKRYQGINFVLATLAQNAFIKYSQYLATVVQRSLRKRLSPVGMKDRGVKQGPFYVMVNATMPNVLVETGFISNKHEARLLRSKSTQSKIALGICEGIIKFKNDFESAL